MSTLTRYDIRALGGPQTLPRLIDYFAKLGLTPSHVTVKEHASWLDIQIDQRGIDERNAAIVLQKMRASVLVETVTMRLI